MTKFIRLYFLLIPCFFVSACNISSFDLAETLNNTKNSVLTKSNTKASGSSLASALPLDNIVDGTEEKIDLDAGFMVAVAKAVEDDFAVNAAKEKYLGSQHLISSLQSQKEFQVSGTLYGGVEDVADEVAGLAVVLNGRRLLYDGGQVDNKIEAQRLNAVASKKSYEAVRNDRALQLALLWVDLERYENLNNLIAARLDVLDPLIQQLEKVAEAGVGDVSQVAAAQRTVSMIRITEADVSERLEGARVKFINAFGGLPSNVDLNLDTVSSLAVAGNWRKKVLEAPGLKAKFAEYQASVATLRSVQLRGEYNVGLEAKLQRPLGGSEYDSDESIGLVINKTFYDGQKLKADLDYSQAVSDSLLAELQSLYKEGKRALEISEQTIKSMANAMVIAADIAQNAKEEISYLRKQLIIGQSTLESVLSAEARLYDAEANEIKFLADRRNAELLILATTGEIASVFNLK